MCSDSVVSRANEQQPKAPAPVVVIVGPTAVGKSSLSLELARRFDGEIINADSMQLYRGLDIGTAKLSLAARRGIDHQLLDVWDLNHLATVSQYQTLARAAIADVQARGRVPFLVGGSGLYINAVIDDLRFPGTDELVRARWEDELDRLGSPALHAHLASVDPLAAARMEPGNGRRIVRALEVIEITGRPYAAQLPFGDRFMPATVIGVTIDRSVLDARISQRVTRMWEQGLVREVEELSRRGLAQAPTASRALGYAQILAMLRGDIDEPRAKEATAAATRRFARKQFSWFCRDERVNWLESGAQPGSLSRLVDVASEVSARALS